MKMLFYEIRIPILYCCFYLRDVKVQVSRYCTYYVKELLVIYYILTMIYSFLSTLMISLYFLSKIFSDIRTL